MRDQKQEILNSITEQEAERELSAAEEGMEDRPEAAAADSCCCGERRKLRSEKEYKDLINRLSRIEGQIPDRGTDQGDQGNGRAGRLLH